MKNRKIVIWLIISTASVLATPFTYAYFIPARTWCHVPYFERTSEWIREAAILALVLIMSIIFLMTIIETLKRVKSPYLNLWIFVLCCAIVVNSFSIYFYTFGLLNTSNSLLYEGEPEIVQSMSEYIYFALGNAIFTSTSGYEPCPSLWLGVTLQRISSLFVALGASLLSARLTRYIEN